MSYAVLLVDRLSWFVVRVGMSDMAPVWDDNTNELCLQRDYLSIGAEQLFAQPCVSTIKGRYASMQKHDSETVDNAYLLNIAEFRVIGTREYIS